jgi:hypothetical protein
MTSTMPSQTDLPPNQDRYTIELSIHKVKEDGNTWPEEEDGCTIDWTTADLATLTDIMQNTCTRLSDGMFPCPIPEDVAPRRPDLAEDNDEQEEWDGEQPKNDAASVIDWRSNPSEIPF